MAKNPFPKARVKTVTVGGVRFGGGALALIAGPCVIESRTMALDLAARLAALARREKIPLVFKASYDKANRTSIGAFRGPGLAKGLEILAEIKAKHRVPILVDVHQVGEVAAAAEVADILQLPAFLCRQTDLVVALGESGRVVNIKKGQFLAPWDVRHVIDKVVSTGNRRILLTERGPALATTIWWRICAVCWSCGSLAIRWCLMPRIACNCRAARSGTGGDGAGAYLSRAAVAAGATGCSGNAPNPAQAQSGGITRCRWPRWRRCGVSAGGFMSWCRVCGAAVVAGLWVLCAAPARAQMEGSVIEGFRLPEYAEDGTLKQQLYGETATFLEDGVIQLTGLKIELFRAGVVNARIYSPTCVYDPNRKRAASKDPVRIVTEKAVLTGDGFAWNGENQQFQIFQNAKLTVDGQVDKRLIMPQPAEAPAEEEE